MTSIFWFKRDLRIEDNRSLFKAVQESNVVIPIFVFNDKILEKFKIKGKRLGFVLRALEKLDKELRALGSRLYCFRGLSEDVFRNIYQKIKFDRVYTTKAESWMGMEIEKTVEGVLSDLGVELIKIRDGFLVNEKIQYRKVFTHFYNEWKKHVDIKTFESINFIKTPSLELPSIEDIKGSLDYSDFPDFRYDIDEYINNYPFGEYERVRDRLDLDMTSKLSPYIRLGVVSVRKLYKNVVKMSYNSDCQYIKELCWREFWYHIKENFSDFNTLEFQVKRRNIKWENDERLIEAFKEGKTGYPIVDAAINQLKKESWMHGRARMVVASFLTKDLLVDWRVGEEFFGEYLLDYDEVVNVGNWQWSASVGPDPKPLRIFNPIIQSQKFDPDGTYIKRYLTGLDSISPFKLHNPLQYDIPYYPPIVNHYERSRLAKSIYLTYK